MYAVIRQIRYGNGMRPAVRLAVIACHHAFGSHIFAGFVVTILAIFRNVKAAVAKLCVHRFSEVVAFLTFTRPCLRPFAELAILALFQNGGVVIVVIRDIFGIVEIHKEVVIAGIEGVDILVKTVNVRPLNAVECPTGLAYGFCEVIPRKKCVHAGRPIVQVARAAAVNQGAVGIFDAAV